MLYDEDGEDTSWEKGVEVMRRRKWMWMWMWRGGEVENVGRGVIYSQFAKW
jgi:hypothetical protein